jgi:arylsulfatase
MWFSGKRFNPAWPYIFNLRSDPFEYAIDSGLYTRWYGQRMFLFVPAQAAVKQFAQSLIDFPPSQAPGSLSLGTLTEKVKAKIAEKRKEKKHTVADQIRSLADDVDRMISRVHQAHP